MQNNIFPKTYEEVQIFAKEIMEKLIKRYKKNNRFDDTLISSSGLIYQCAGSICFLLLANSFDEIDLDEESKDILRNEFQKVCNYIKEKGFDATPLVSDERTEDFFSPDAKLQYHYLDSVGFVLSMMVHMRTAHRKKKLEIANNDMNTLNEMIKQTLEIICDSSLKGGGWGFAKGCDKPDLYYSYAICESLADVGDYILGETPEIIGEDEEMKNYLGQPLIQRVEEKRKAAANWLINDYLPDMGKKMIYPMGEKIKDVDEYILLYYTYFVIDMLIVTKADIFFEDKKEEIYRAIEHGIYLSRIAFDNARKDADWWNNSEKSSLHLEWRNHKNIDSNIPSGSSKLIEPGLVPLSMRCNALYAYYISEGEDKKMEDLSFILMDDRDKKTGLWDSIGYSLLNTERSIEALVDYADYIKRFKAGSVSIVEEDKTVEKETDIEVAIQKLVYETVKKYINSPQGNKMMIDHRDNSTTLDLDKEDFSNRCLDSFINILETGKQVISGDKDEYIDINEKKYNKLFDSFSNFISLLLYNRLKKAIVDSDHQDNIKANIKEKEAEIFDWLTTYLSNDKNILDPSGDILSWLIDEYTKRGGK